MLLFLVPPLALLVLLLVLLPVLLRLLHLTCMPLSATAATAATALTTATAATAAHGSLLLVFSAGNAGHMNVPTTGCAQRRHTRGFAKHPQGSYISS